VQAKGDKAKRVGGGDLAAGLSGGGGRGCGGGLGLVVGVDASAGADGRGRMGGDGGGRDEQVPVAAGQRD
jgi:hypothetical protein